MDVSLDSKIYSVSVQFLIIFVPPEEPICRVLFRSQVALKTLARDF